MIRPLHFLHLLILLALSAGAASAQVTTGTPPFGSFGGGPDVVNLANLNSHISIPVLHKAGRGTNFTYDLSYDTSVWYPITSGSTTTWQPVVSFGWRGVTEIATGFISYNTWQGSCYDDAHILRHFTVDDTWVFHDPFGTAHNFPNMIVVLDAFGCSGLITANSDTASDGSGYSITNTSSTSATIYSSTGMAILAPINVGTGAASFTDRNGNKITTDGTGKFYDTMSSTTPVLTVSGSGTPSSPMKFTYTSPSGGAPYYQVNYTNYTVATNFGISGISEYKSQAAVPLVSSIVLPDGSQYSFLYEATPATPAAGACTPYAGTTCVTARLISVTLPTGGAISYAYTGGNNGIFSDGSTAGLKRYTPDTGTGSYWKYDRAPGTGAAYTTTVTDPLGNQTQIQFQGSYETQRKTYQGSTTGTLLQTVNTCYNGSAAPCTATAIVLPITQRTVNATLPGAGNLQSQHTDRFDSYGNVTESDDYGFATAAPFPLLRQTLITYATLGNYLNAFMQTVTVKDGNGVIKSRQDTSYDQYSSFTGANCITGAPQHNDTSYGCTFTARGNATSLTSYTDPVTPGGAITKSFTYDSLGNLRTAQLNCCQQKQWNYSATTQYAYPDSVLSGSSSSQLTTSFTYNNNTGMVLTSTDENNQTTSFAYDNLLRMTTATRSADSAQITYTYPAPNTTPLTLKVTAPLQGTTTTQQITTLDTLGRPTKVTAADSSGTSYSISETQYDAFGRPYKQSNPHNSTAQYWTTAQFDPLGRVTSTTLPDNSQTSYSYTDATVTVTDPTGKQRKMQYDALGRLVSVWEPDPANGNSLTLQTTYAYTVLGALTSVTQGSQTRTYSYDALGRLTSVATPEAKLNGVQGTISYAYDNFNNLTSRTDARNVVTNYGYDGLNRLTSVSYNVGTTGVPATPTVSLTYGTSAAQFNNGRPVTMTDGVGSENYAYNNLGQMTQFQKIISGTTYTMSYAYNTAGELTTVTYPSGRVVQQNMDAIGRLASIVGTLNSVNTTYASGFSYNPAFQATGFQYGNGLFASFGFSADRLQLNCLDYSTTNRTGTCAHDTTTKFGLTYSYGSTGSNNGQIAGITDSVDNGRSAAFTYDALYRLSTAVTTGSTGYAKWGLSWTYDRYGNALAETQTYGSPANFSVSVDATSNHITGSPYAYDANGNMTNDGNNTLVYDAENRAVSATNGGSSGAYAYDGNGLRVKKVSGSTTTVYLFSGSKVIAEYANGAAPTSPSREYIYSGGALLAKIEAGATKYYHQDHLSNRLVTDSSGNTLEQLGHFPFGESWYNTSNDKLLFTTYERDSESGNDYARARTYISRLGRFSSPDPLPGTMLDPQSLNRYAYARNAPSQLNDPTGLQTCYMDGAETPCSQVLAFVDKGGGGGGSDAFAVVPLGFGDIQFATGKDGNVYAYFLQFTNDPDNPVQAYYLGGLTAGQIEALFLPSNFDDYLTLQGLGGGGILTDQVTNARISSLLGDLLKKFGKSHCAKVFAAVIPRFSPSAFENKISGPGTNYYDIRSNPVASFTQNDATGNGNSTLLSQSLAFGTTARTINGGLTKQTAILLGANFFSGSPTEQGNTLFHEAVHAFTGWGDATIFNSFAGYGLQHLNAGTGDISNWIGTDCNTTPSGAN